MRRQAMPRDAQDAHPLADDTDSGAEQWIAQCAQRITELDPMP